jgi:hypothetical protein
MLICTSRLVAAVPETYSIDADGDVHFTEAPGNGFVDLVDRAAGEAESNGQRNATAALVALVRRCFVNVLHVVDLPPLFRAILDNDEGTFLRLANDGSAGQRIRCGLTPMMFATALLRPTMIIALRQVLPGHDATKFDHLGRSVIDFMTMTVFREGEVVWMWGACDATCGLLQAGGAVRRQSV